MPKVFQRVLAIHPTTKGFGFVVMEGPDRIVDWGLRESKKEGLDARVALLEGLFARYSPNAFVVERYDPARRRSERAREFTARSVLIAAGRKVKVRVVTRAEVRTYFESRGARTKMEIARLVAQRYPELTRLLPPPRRAWMSEDARMSIFAATAMALCHGSIEIPIMSVTTRRVGG